MESVWAAEKKVPCKKSGSQPSHTDVLVIGGGLAGLLCTWQLHQAGMDCLLVEADTLCSGVTQNTTAKITSQHGFVYHKLIKRFGEERARLYLEANEAALTQYRRLSQAIDCDFEEQDNFIYSLDDPRKVERELQALSRLGYPADFRKNLPLPFSVAGAVRFPRQAQFHPLKFAAAIARNLPVLEHTRVLEIAPRRVVTDQGPIVAETIIVATHFPLLNKHGSYYLKQYQSRSYVLALEQVPPVDGMYLDDADTGLSFRRYRNLLLLGGSNHRTGKRSDAWQALSAFTEQHYPQAKEVARWAAQDCMTLDNIPYIGRYSRHTDNLYVATGFNKWGMTSSMVAAMLLTDLVQGKDNPWKEVFSPSRSILRPQLAANVLESAVNFLTPTAPRCPHMGCALKWNPQEHSWDCPCHGSRFTKNGALLDNPATGDLPHLPKSL